MSQSRLGESSNSCNNNNSFNTNNSFNNTSNSININTHNVNNFGSTDERDKILAWISPLEPRIRHHDIRTHRVEHVGDWFLQRKEYRNWFEDTHGGEPDNSALLCYGDPGVGKTYITSLVIDSLCDWAKGQNAIVACFYLDFAAQKEQSPTSILGSLLKQVVGGLEKIPENIARAFRDQEKAIGGRKLGLDEIVEMLQDISSSQRIFICIDALDECMAEYRATLLDSLRQISHNSPSTRIFLAGRLHIRDEMEKHLAGKVVALSVAPTRDDIVRFLRAKLKEDTTPDAMDHSLEEDIIKTIPAKVSEIFLLVSLNIKAILEETTLHRRREKLGAITNGLGLEDVYGVTIGRINARAGDRGRLGMAALMWISHSERTLGVDEICHALAVEIGSTGINTNNVPSIRTVLSCCQGLVAIDKWSSTIRLIHFTLGEYLSHHSGLFDRPHSKIAETCLTYLNFRAIKDLSASASHNRRDTPFLEYSSLYWGTHMRMELSDLSRYLALDLLGQYENHISSKLLSGSIGERPFSALPFPALHCVSYFGISEVALDLIRTERRGVNQRDSVGLTPLMWAVRYGREEVVKFLLRQKHTKPDMRDTKYSRTALSWAAGSGQGEVVRIFLGPLFVNPGRIGRRWGKIAQVMSVLFGKKYFNPNMPDGGGRTPLSWAAENGHDGVVKLLLGREDVSPDRPDNDGRTPLSWAAGQGYASVAKLLLGWENVNPDRPDNDGRTPLSWAAGQRHPSVAKLLLGRESVRPDRPDNNGRTPLSWAASQRYASVARLLLGRESVNPDRPDNNGRTPLSWAASQRSASVAWLLFGRERVNPDRPDNNGRAPLSWAAEGGHYGVVMLLFGHAGASPDRLDNDGKTPLSRATKNRHDRVVKILMGQEAISSNMPDTPRPKTMHF